MPAISASKYKKVTITHKIKSNVLEVKQELKEELLEGLVMKHYEEVDFSQSINNVATMKNYLWKKYEVTFIYTSVRKCLTKVRKHFNKLAEERRLRRQQEEEDERLW